MVAGLCSIDLHFPDNRSLKEKRQILRGMKERVRQRFNVSIAEVDGLDLWQRVTLGVSCVSTDRRQVNRTLDQVVQYLERFPQVEVLDYRIEML